MKQLALRFGFMLVLVSVIMCFVAKDDILISFSEPVDIYEDYPADFRDVKAVETELYMLFDIFAEEETTTTNNSGAITSRRYDYYYILPVFTAEEEYYVGVKVSSKKSAPYDDLMDSTWSYLMGETDSIGDEVIEFQGGFVEMDDELYQYFQDWFKEAEFFESDQEMDKYLLPLVLESVNYERVKTMTFVMIGVFIVGIILIILGLKPKKAVKEATNPIISINGVSYPSSNFIRVNSFVERGQKVKAIKELRDITGLDLAQAKDIVDRWNEYWY